MYTLFCFEKVECLTAVLVVVNSITQDPAFPTPSEKLLYAAGNICNCYAMLKDINKHCYATADELAGAHIPFDEIIQGGDEMCPQVDQSCALIGAFDADCVGAVSGVDAVTAVCEEYAEEILAIGDPTSPNANVPSFQDDPEIICASEVVHT